MATVTGLTAARMQEIIDATIVSAYINVSGHLILVLYDTTEIDVGYMLASVPDASETVKGIVELATPAETITGTDNTRAVTPLAFEEAVLSAIALHGTRYLDGDDWDQTTTPITYPSGESVMYLSASQATAGGWDFGGKWGVVRTFHHLGGGDVTQTWQRIGDPGIVPEFWNRCGNNAGGWGAWRVLAQVSETLAPTRHRFTSNNASWAPPDGAKKFYYELLGGGGGGGGGAAAGSGQHSAGGGGQAGAMTSGWIDRSSFGATLAIVVGAAGTAGAAGNNAGGAGGASTIDSTVLTAPGGNGGNGSVASNVVFGTNGGGSTTVGTGETATQGAPGGYGFGGGNLGVGGVGGSSRYGSGGLGGVTTVATQSIAGQTGSGFGAGGGGGLSSTGGAAAAGGAGRAGLVIIDVYY